MRRFWISSKDLARCPIRSMSPRHYQIDGSCLCRQSTPQPPSKPPVDGWKWYSPKKKQSKP
jgi:hypothetical protein